jgi:drug/metabolite transporter (DMT)-like permease
LTGSTPEGGAADNPRAALGLVFAVLGATSFGVITTLARITYDAGGSPATVIAARFVGFSLMLVVLLWLLRRPFRLPRRSWPRLGAMTIGVFGLTVGYLSSVAFIPVSLAALIFYTFPLMVVAAVAVMTRSPPGFGRSASFLIAFGGLALALGPSFDALNWQGVSWALLGAGSAALVFVAGRPLLARHDVFTVAFNVNLLCTLLIGASLPWLGGMAPPSLASGWLALGAASLCYLAAVITQFFALRHVGAARTALIFNIEPLVSIGFAAVLLGERLGPPQLAGVALVAGALVLASGKNRNP